MKLNINKVNEFFDKFDINEDTKNIVRSMIYQIIETDIVASQTKLSFIVDSLLIYELIDK